VTNVSVEIVSYDPEWPSLFAAFAKELRASLGDVAVRIDHIGSTAVPDLTAKPIIDIQISVTSFEPLDAYRAPLERLGLTYRKDNPERTKRYFREPPGTRRTHVHVRVAGSFSEQLALLFRDFLRAHPDVAAEYAELKRSLALELGHDRHAYTSAKVPFTWKVIAKADEWAQSIGWEPGPSKRVTCWGPKRWLESCRAPMVLMDGSAENVAAADLRPGYRLGTRSWVGRLKVEAAMRSDQVVVLGHALRTRCRWRLPKTRMWSRHSRRTEPTHRSANAFALGERTGVFTAVSPSVRNTSSTGLENLASRSRSRMCLPSRHPVIARLRACWVTRPNRGGWWRRRDALASWRAR
jgi:GrpB-like predicted nucleotidyltransferase (UPF0157 family)